MDQILWNSLSVTQQASLVSTAQAMALLGDLMEDSEPASDSKLFPWYLSLACAIGCVCLAALAAGLTLGVGGIDAEDLELLIKSNELFQKEEEDPAFVPKEGWKEKRAEAARQAQWAQNLVPIIGRPRLEVHESIDGERKWGGWWGWRRFACTRVSRGHLRLVTLLLLNSIANEALPIFLSNAFPPIVPEAWHEYLSVGFAVTFVLIFGEIIPSAIFTGHCQLRLASAFSLPIQLIQLLAMPLAFPISLVMDCVRRREYIYIVVSSSFNVFVTGFFSYSLTRNYFVLYLHSSQVLSPGHKRTLLTTQQQKAQIHITLLGHLPGDGGGSGSQDGCTSNDLEAAGSREGEDRVGILEDSAAIMGIIIDIQNEALAGSSTRSAVAARIVDALAAQGHLNRHAMKKDLVHASLAGIQVCVCVCVFVCSLFPLSY